MDDKPPHGRNRLFPLILMPLVLMAFLHFSPPRACAVDREPPPPGGISVSPEYTGIIVPQGEDVGMDLIVANLGQTPEDIRLDISEIPEGWTAHIRTSGFKVTGIHVPGHTVKRLTLAAQAGEEVMPGEYAFRIHGRTTGGMDSSATLRVKVVESEGSVKGSDVVVTTSYPVLQGPTGSEFEFSLDVESRLEKDAIYDLSAQAPKDWDVFFKPAYEEQVISSLRIKAGQSRSMAVVVKPYGDAEPAEYPIHVKVSSEEARSKAVLTVILTGTHQMEVGTPDGRLSLSAFQGEAANLSFYVKNSGSAPQSNIRFLSFKPESWNVKFLPESIAGLAPGAVEQVEVTVEPSGRSLVGDYLVSLVAQAEKVTRELDLRVTVKASTAWGWVGIGIILFVIGGLATLFIRMGRR